MNEWISVKDRFPLELDAAIPYRASLVIVTNGESVGFAVFEAGNGCGKPWRKFSDYSGYSGSIEYWMPLPPPPAQEQ